MRVERTLIEPRASTGTAPRAPLSLSFALVVVTFATPACSRVPPEPATSTVVLTPSSLDLPAGVDAGEFHRALTAAAEAWSAPAIPCTSLRIVVAEPERKRLAGDDSTNLVVFRGTRWCHNERCGPGATFPLRAAAMTTVFPDGAGPGRVREADVELNGAHFSWAPGADAKPLAPLRAVLVHELGHMLGLRDGTAPAGGAMSAVGPLAPSPEEARQVCEAFPR